jgi:flagellar protein FliO/FliZ
MMDSDLIVRFVLALGLVLALIAVTGWVGRRYLGAGRIATFSGKKRRLALVETLQIDARTRLLLVRRDAAEHLIMLGSNGAVVVEAGIATGGFAQAVDAVNAGEVQ